MHRPPKPEDMPASVLSSMVNAGVPITPVKRTIVTEIPPDVPWALVHTGLFMFTRPNVDQVNCFSRSYLHAGLTAINDNAVQFKNSDLNK